MKVKAWPDSIQFRSGPACIPLGPGWSALHEASLERGRPRGSLRGKWLSEPGSRRLSRGFWSSVCVCVWRDSRGDGKGDRFSGHGMLGPCVSPLCLLFVGVGACLRTRGRGSNLSAGTVLTILKIKVCEGSIARSQRWQRHLWPSGGKRGRLLLWRGGACQPRLWQRAGYPLAATVAQCSVWVRVSHGAVWHGVGYTLAAAAARCVSAAAVAGSGVHAGCRCGAVQRVGAS